MKWLRLNLHEKEAKIGANLPGPDFYQKQKANADRASQQPDRHQRPPQGALGEYQSAVSSRFSAAAGRAA
jgi:hypothetical protein